MIFDVGHQAYAYKILTDRREKFEKLRQEDGVSGFPLISESKYDYFTSGHAGDALAGSLGYCYARDLQKQDNYVITFTGDSSLVNGESLEALLSTSKKPDKFLVILNDNQMSISPNANAFSKFLSCEDEDSLSKADFLSKNGHNIDDINSPIANENYYCVPKELVESIKDLVPDHVGILAYYNGNTSDGLRCIKKAKRIDVPEKIKIVLLYNAMKKWCDGAMHPIS